MDLYGLIGKTLGHSFSQTWFREKFRREDIDADYHLFELDNISRLPALVESCPGLRGLNVTIPYKESVIPFLHELSPAAAAAGAVNTIVIQNGRMIGHNTDVWGFSQSLRKWIQHAPLRQAIILGTGGASKAVCYALRQDWGVGEPLLVSRRAAEGVLSYDMLSAIAPQDFDLLVNTTPLGMYPDTDTCPAFPFECLISQHWVMDLVYNPGQTRFLQRAAGMGAKTRNGLEMLHLQAEEAWRIWNIQHHPGASL